MPSQAGIPLLQIDAFAAEPFTGNPAAVCLPATEPPAARPRREATEVRRAGTAFARRSGNGFGLRWFTPVAEVDLCGHATLATAHALWETGRLAKGDPAVFQTRSGRLSARQDGAIIELDFPAEPATPC
ncbi:MAG: PhzF family phenazine biosynthesis protein, partial [Verrucomicrobiota bacterium]|nr:PhzF family phenazine biosynthesis protein [Verrucomicrobiota bacterium]